MVAPRLERLPKISCKRYGSGEIGLVHDSAPHGIIYNNEFSN